MTQYLILPGNRTIKWPTLLTLSVLSVLAGYIAIWPSPYPFSGMNERRLLKVAGDHWLHFSFCLLATILLSLLTSPPPSPLLIYGVMVVVAVGSEAIQGALPWKQFDWFDVIANLVGIATGAGIMAIVHICGWRGSTRQNEQIVTDV